MDGTLIFVHGTGVRRKAYEIDWRNLKNQAEGAGFRSEQLVSVPWGPTRREGIPDKHLLKEALPPRGWFGLTAEDDAEAWTFLSADPLLELRLAAMPGRRVQAGPTTEPGVDIRAGWATVELRGTGIRRRELERAAKVVSLSDEYDLAARSSLGLVPGALEAASARAIVGLLHHWHADDAPGSQPAAFRGSAAHRELLSRISGHLGASAEVASDSWDDLKWFITAAGRFLRPWLTGLATGFLADVLWHVRAGKIQSDIATAVRAADRGGGRPIVVLAHSLGGIAAIDLMTNPGRPKQADIDLLVTYGSQSSVLFAMDAMRYLREPTAKRPRRPFPRWLNLYDKNDLIGFAAGPLRSVSLWFKEKPVSSNLPFPDSHGAYIDQDEFWRFVTESWPNGSTGS